MIRVAVAGVAGRMGTWLAKLAVDTPGMELVGATEMHGHEVIGENVGDIIGKKGLGVTIRSKVEEAIVEADVFIDFTSPKATIIAADACAKNKVAMVIGTTGLDKEQIKNIAATASRIPIVQSPNMSLGVNLMAKLVAQASKALGDAYDVEMVELHHKMKADSPSGTALLLAKSAMEARGLDLDKTAVYGRQGRADSRPKEQIGVMSLRLGDVVGEHTVVFAGPGERIEIVHRAHSRETFAQGAIRAAQWVIGKKPALYTMADVLGLD